MVCPECGTEIDDPRAFCPYCGAPLREAPADHPLWEALFPCLIALGMAGGEGLRSCAGGGYMDTPRYGHAGRHPRRTLRIVCMGQGPGAPPAGRRKSARRAV